MKKVAAMIRSAVLSPTGVRAAFEARGDIHTLPAEKGQARNLTASAGVTIAARCGRPMARRSRGCPTRAASIS